MQDFNDKVVLVTGASSGMGRATALELSRRGAKVICAARRRDRGEEVVAELRAAGGQGEFFQTDVSDATSVAALFRFIEEKYQRLDGAFNNAGIEVDHASVPDVAIKDLDQVLAVNVRGTFMCLQHELRIMRAQKSGAVVNTSSVGGITGLRNSSAYVTSKYAVVGMTKSAALDAAEFGARVNVICPGACDTEMMQRWTQGNPAIKQHLANYAAMKRVGNPQEVADAAIWLLSDASSYVTGLVMAVDGGVTAGLAM